MAEVPIADNGGGDYCCLDLAPPPKGGTFGQVILYGHDGGQRRVARSFAEWMGKLARRFRAGKIAFDENDGLIEA